MFDVELLVELLADDTLLDELLDELALSAPTVLLDELDRLANTVEVEDEVESDDGEVDD